MGVPAVSWSSRSARRWLKRIVRCFAILEYFLFEVRMHWLDAQPLIGKFVLQNLFTIALYHRLCFQENQILFSFFKLLRLKLSCLHVNPEQMIVERYDIAFLPRPFETSHN